MTTKIEECRALLAELIDDEELPKRVRASALTADDALQRIQSWERRQSLKNNGSAQEAEEE